eukprot:gene29665-36747_t
MPEQELKQDDLQQLKARAISQPLVEHIYTADPSAHVFNGRLYVYPSHDIEAGIAFNDNGDHFAMEDYRVLSMDRPGAQTVDHGVALHVNDVPWAARQMWAPDAAFKDGKYYLYFPAKKADGIFQIGVAIGDDPAGPFVPEAAPIEGSYSIDPAVFEDSGEHYIYFGGIWGGQLQKYRDNVYSAANEEPADGQPALQARVARLGGDMKQFAEAPPLAARSTRGRWLACRTAPASPLPAARSAARCRPQRQQQRPHQRAARPGVGHKHAIAQDAVNQNQRIQRQAPCWMGLAECDPLVDEGVRYAD